MKLRSVTVGLAALLLAFAASAQTPEGPAPAPKYPNYPSETPDKFTPTSDGHDYVRRIAEIPV